MKNCNLIVILDRGLVGTRDIYRVANEIMEGGAPCIQLRDKLSDDKTLLKEAKKLRRLTARRRCAFIVNDRADIALASGADGIHIGSHDISYQDARNMLGKDAIIGISTHSPEKAFWARMLGANYIGVGPIFQTTTKPSLKPIGTGIVTGLSKVIKILPCFYIGGITLNNIDMIIDRGGTRVAVASAILNSKDIREATRAFIDKLTPLSSFEMEPIKT